MWVCNALGSSVTFRLCSARTCIPNLIALRFVQMYSCIHNNLALMELWCLDTCVFLCTSLFTGAFLLKTSTSVFLTCSWWRWWWRCMCMHSCMCVTESVHMCAHLCDCAHMRTRVVCVWVCVGVCVCVYVNESVCVQACVRVCIQVAQRHTQIPLSETVINYIFLKSYFPRYLWWYRFVNSLFMYFFIT